MKRFSISLKMYIFMAVVLLLLGVGLFLLLSKPGFKTPERALFVYTSSLCFL